ncbi:hypothetical protein AA309_00845 [Microvirga vignae]|uniref:Uncharacterized protein n=1 Tax=Microvirga vignae TaxID=1225564 RepID=A0A0H1RQ60_9HYPH|nr:hypothetical protein [Microvirga vignae]KLK94787.1 hypothetical protein AA309_00845 [Microvirga vignae]
MLPVILVLTLIAVVVYAYGSGLFSRDLVLRKLTRIPVLITAFAVLALSTVYGFRDDPEIADLQTSALNHAADVEATAAIPQPVLPEPLHPKEAATACVEHALNEARTTDDLVAESWLSSVEGFLETAPGEVTVQFAVGPRVGSSKGRQCRSEARLTCAVTGRDVRPITPVHMTGAQIAC